MNRILIKRFTTVLTACLITGAYIQAKETEPTGAEELSMYLESPTFCKGKNAELAAREGLKQYHLWKIDDHKANKKTFAQAGQALEYLYKDEQCRDGLMMYRYGNLLRHNKKYSRSINIMEESLPKIRKHYPKLEAVVLGSLGRACVAEGQHKKAISYYRNALDIDPSDVGVRLNLASQLYYQGKIEDARNQVIKAMEYPMSDYGKEVAHDLLEKTKLHKQQ